MALTKKTTILLSKPLERGLKRMAKARHTSMGQLIREACCKQYGIGMGDDALEALEELESLALPVDDVSTMKSELVPAADDLMP